MTTRAHGPFEVKFNPLPLHEGGQDPTLARMSIDKQFRGDLDATSRGTPQLTIHVVPDSGTEQLSGLIGTMAINIVDGKHSYDFDYALP